MADTDEEAILREFDRLDEPTADESLASRLIESFVSSNFHDPARDYLPEACFSRLITPEKIEDELRKVEETHKNYDRKRREDVVTWIREKAQKTFAIAVQCHDDPWHLFLSMELFRVTGFHDTQLPLPDPLLFAPSPKQFNKKTWTDLKIRDFYERQWRCLAPVFSPERYNYDLPYNCIFPFTKESVTPKVGAFGSVHKVRIHRDHQLGYTMQHVAIKEIQVTRGNDKQGTDEAWEKEAGALANINKLKHPHITECVAAIRRGDSRYFMFPWADGDSLRDYWIKTPRQSPGPNGDLVSQAIQQLKGLADALDCLHYSKGGHAPNGTSNGVQIQRKRTIPQMRFNDEYDEEGDYMNQTNTKSIRHGDLKPENILRFTTRGTKLGILKIADMGLAKQHIVATQDRTHLTSTRYGTIQYEAPEAIGELNGPRSRLYDVWSMGCITLEFIIWLLYGNDELNNFYGQLKGDAPQQQHCQYFEMPAPGGLGGPEVHRVVRTWIKAMQDTDPECASDTALGELLQLVQEKLLIVPLPPNRESSTRSGRRLAPPALGETVTKYRATAAEFRNALDDIISKIQLPGYLTAGRERVSVQLPIQTTTMLSPAAAAQRHEGPVFPKLAASQEPMLSGVLGRPIRTSDYALPPLKDWEFSVDNDFAETLATRVKRSAYSPIQDARTRLCVRCSQLDFWVGGFTFDDTILALEDRAETCDFCRILNEVSVKGDGSKRIAVGFERKQSILLIVGEPYPVLSIFRTFESRPPTRIQLGFPEPPQPGTNTSFEIMKLWLEDCNTRDANGAKHQDCHTQGESIPTRLIDVGTLMNPNLRLVETREEGILRADYIALSHPWGDTKKHPPFCTLRSNIDALKQSISYEELPATFKDAVYCTRKLNIRYLWIDSICIIQGDGGDFNEESKRMEDVFSGAYCVLAASRATSQRDGFLGPRKKRDFVTFQRNLEKPFYIAKTIDNFNKDVIEGSLNKRGWVLQERALARRTIYFTENQTYFECGDGIRCETMTKMRNNMADFLGDPKFPAKSMRANRAEKIAYFQGLYKQYSRLNFTRYDDRPFAIAGLEKRLQNAFGTRGGYGIFDDGDKPNGGLFHRSLLWQRGEEPGDAECLTPIDFPPERNIKVPSWSWMAYKGGIDFMDPKFQSADWETEELHPPWTYKHNHNVAVPAPPPEQEVAITATVRNFDVAGRQAHEVKFSYDTERRTASNGQRAQCVIVAKGRESRSDRDRKYFVLLVTPVPGREGVYERVGVGVMLGKFIRLDGEGVAAKMARIV